MIGQVQPEVGRRLSGHPITDKLVMAVNFSKPDAIATLAGIYDFPEDSGVAGPGSYVSANVTYVQGLNRYGYWAGFSGAALNSKFSWPRSDFLPTSQGCTVLILYEKADSTNRASYAFTLDMLFASEGTARCAAHLPFSDGTVYWDFGGVTAGSTRVSAASLTFGADRWVFSTGSRGMEIWQNGLLRASNGANPTRTASAATSFVLGARVSDAVFSDIAHYNVFALWARQLTGDEILMVSADPYMLWEAPLLFYERGRAADMSSTLVGFPGSRAIFRRRPERWG